MHFFSKPCSHLQTNRFRVVLPLLFISTFPLRRKKNPQLSVALQSIAPLYKCLPTLPLCISLYSTNTPCRWLWAYQYLLRGKLEKKTREEGEKINLEKIAFSITTFLSLSLSSKRAIYIWHIWNAVPESCVMFYFQCMPELKVVGITTSSILHYTLQTQFQ